MKVKSQPGKSYSDDDSVSAEFFRINEMRVLWFFIWHSPSQDVKYNLYKGVFGKKKRSFSTKILPFKYIDPLPKTKVFLFVRL